MTHPATLGARPAGARARNSKRVITALALLSLAVAPGIASAGICTQTADTLLEACRADAQDNDLVGQAVCLNIGDANERAACTSDLESANTEALTLCDGQHQARLDTCSLIGSGRYDPPFEPGGFDDPRQPSHPNPYYPLKVGNRWEYTSGSERNVVRVLNATKSIEGVDCLVVHDRVFDDGVLIEDTNDWFAAAKNGAVWYCGEETKQFEIFDGDVPQVPELVGIEGSFKAGREGSKPGIIFLASPHTGDAYLEEFSLGTAEDLSLILSTDYAYGKDADLDRLVPARLAQRLCNGDCVVTRNTSQLEPGVVERKYYARGIGVFLETAISTGEVTQLTGCNFDKRCRDLPRP
jgi:hypothetical protein